MARSWRIAGAAWAILVAVVVLAAPSPSMAAPEPQSGTLGTGIEETVLASRLLDEVPAGRRWVLRRRHPLNDDAHAHAGGFIYAARGRSYLVVDDTQGAMMDEGRAAWAPEGIGHLHTTPFRGSNGRPVDDGTTEVWTILLERETDLRQTGAAVVSPPLIGIQSGPYEARLVARTFQAGAATSLLQRTGPELAYTLEGAWELEYAGVPWTLGAGQGYLADPGVPHRLRNVGSGPARLISAVLVPAGQPAELSAP